MYGATGSVKRSASFPFCFHLFSLPLPFIRFYLSSLFLSHFFSRSLVEARYYFYVPLHWQPWLRIDLKKTRVTERLEILLAAVRATGNSVNNKSAGRQRRLAVTTHRVSLFVPWFCAFTEPELLVPVESEFRCYAPSNRGTSVRLITSRLFEHARLDIDFSEKKSDTILRYLK